MIRNSCFFPRKKSPSSTNITESSPHFSGECSANWFSPESFQWCYSEDFSYDQNGFFPRTKTGNETRVPYQFADYSPEKCGEPSVMLVRCGFFPITKTVNQNGKTRVPYHPNSYQMPRERVCELISEWMAGWKDVWNRVTEYLRLDIVLPVS